MDKIKKYLIFSASALLLATSVFALIYAFTGLFNVAKVNELASKLLELEWIEGAERNKDFARIIVSLVMSSGLISVGFAAFSARFAFYSSQEYYEKQSVLITMAVLFLIIPAPILVTISIIDFSVLSVATIILTVLAGAAFLTATLFKDRNFVPQLESGSEVDILEVKLTKLKDLKEKNLITE